MTGLVPALLAGAALWLVLPGPGRAVAIRAPVPEVDPASGVERPLLFRLRPLLVAGVVFAGWTVVGGALGLGLGAGAAVLAWRGLGAVGSVEARRVLAEIERDQPIAVQLLSACLRAGSSVPAALDAVADALPGAVAEEFARIRRRLEFGVDPLTVWRDVAQGPTLPGLGRALARAYASGAAVTTAVDLLAADLQAGLRSVADVRARSVEVRSAVPLGVCFLPAFVLVGVVPMVAGVFSSVRLTG